MTSRPIVLVFLLLVLIITSQFEWKQQISEAEANPTVSQRKQQILDREEAVKEKVSRKLSETFVLFKAIIFINSARFFILFKMHIFIYMLNTYCLSLYCLF